MSDTERESLHIQTGKSISSFDAMAHQQYRSQFGDTTFTKLFVGGLAWETPTEEMHKYFGQFGDILEAVVITDKNTGKSKGYGFVTFNDEESARRACADPNPVIDGRRANCNIASLGRTRPSPPRGRDGGGRGHGRGASHGGVPAAGPPSMAQAPPDLLYPSYSYGYQTYTPDYGYHQGTMYNYPQPQLQQAQYYQQQLYGTSSSTMGSPYNYYGYSSVQSPRSTFSYSPHPNQLSAAAGPSYLYYPTTVPMDVSFSGIGYRPPQQPPIRQPFPSPTDSQTQQCTSSESTAGVVRNSESTSNSHGENQ